MGNLRSIVSTSLLLGILPLTSCRTPQEPTNLYPYFSEGPQNRVRLNVPVEVERTIQVYNSRNEIVGQLRSPISFLNIPYTTGETYTFRDADTGKIIGEPVIFNGAMD